MTSTLPPLVQAFSGAIGSASANALAYPLDLVTTRLQLESPERSKKQGGLFGAALIVRHIFKKYGWEAFYDGLWPDTCATVLSNFFYFYFYSFLRSLSTRGRIPSTTAKKSGPHKPSLLEELVLGFIAGVASRAISTPLNIVTLRIQTEREDADEFEDVSTSSEPAKKEAGITDVVKAIYKEQGLKGFWRGFQMAALLSLNPSLTVAFFQLFRRLISVVKASSLNTILTSGVRSLRHAPTDAALKPWEAFFGGAISNSIAVAILYPLILAKKRLQSSSSTTMGSVLSDAYHGRPQLRRNMSYQDKEKAEGISQRDVERAPGIEGLYQGLQMKIITGFLDQGVTFLVKGRIEQLVIAAYLARRARR
ncbi:mitochondrial carrier [Agrocybe pediades]|nr:mitochondrial carrier [Agrocybe pediades]